MFTEVGVLMACKKVKIPQFFLPTGLPERFRARRLRGPRCCVIIIITEVINISRKVMFTTVRFPLPSAPLDGRYKTRYDCIMMTERTMTVRRLDPVARALRAELAAERREWAEEDARIAAIYASGVLNRLPASVPTPVAEATRYTVTVLPSAVKAQARAAKAAATRRRNRAARG
jgi:hypothetical protein